LVELLTLVELPGIERSANYFSFIDMSAFYDLVADDSVSPPTNPVYSHAGTH
jgi:hypothetical protein